MTEALCFKFFNKYYIEKTINYVILNNVGYSKYVPYRYNQCLCDHVFLKHAHCERLPFDYKRPFMSISHPHQVTMMLQPDLKLLTAHTSISYRICGSALSPEIKRFDKVDETVKIPLRQWGNPFINRVLNFSSLVCKSS